MEHEIIAINPYRLNRAGSWPLPRSWGSIVKIRWFSLVDGYNLHGQLGMAQLQVRVMSMGKPGSWVPTQVVSSGVVSLPGRTLLSLSRTMDPLGNG